MKVLQKALERPASLPALIDWDIGMRDEIKKRLGFGFSSIVFVLQNGALKGYRDMAGLVEFLKGLFFHKQRVVEKLLKEFRVDYQIVESLVEQSKRLLITKNLNRRRIIKLIGDFSYYYRRLWPPVIFSYWLPHYLDGSILRKSDKARFNRIVQARHKKDKEYVYALQFFDNVFALIKKLLPNVKCSLDLCTPLELKQILKSQNCPSLLAEKIRWRKKGCLIFNGRVVPVRKSSEISQFLHKYKLKLEKEKPVPKTKILSGVVACKGRVVGRARLLFSKKDMERVKLGEIIISPMTTPYFNSALKKAGAIVTDEGGITCHAAIMARELGIPCVIGTRNATKIVKNGDKINVDADIGKVIISERCIK